MSNYSWRIGLLAITVVGALLRFYKLGELPYGVYQDEAWHGLDALALLDSGNIKLYFEANNGREPLYIYLVTAAVYVFGPTAYALRIPAAILGTLTIPASYLMGFALSKRQSVGLYMAAFCALSLWPLTLSRIAFRAVSLPLFMALAIGLIALAMQASSIAKKRTFASLGGACVGLLLYTYAAAQLAVLGALLWVGLTLISNAKLDRQVLLAAALAAALVALPIALFAYTAPDVYFARSNQVAIWELEANNGTPLVVDILRHAWQGLLMFVWQGDRIARHNMPYRPVFDAVGGVMFLTGTAIITKNAIQRLRQWQVSSALFVLFALGCMLVSTVLAEDTPHFLRGIGVLVPALYLAGVGLDHLLSRFQQWQVRFGVAVLVLSIVGSLTTVDYFVRYVDVDNTRVFFQHAVTKMADRVDGTVPTYVQQRLWDDFSTMRYLSHNKPIVVFDTALPEVETAQEFQVLLYPHNGVPQHVLAQLPSGIDLEKRTSAAYRGDLDEQSYDLFNDYQISASVKNTETLATFGSQLQLHALSIEEEATQLQVRLQFSLIEATADPLKVFIHLKDDAGNVIAQADQLILNGDINLLNWNTQSSLAQIFTVSNIVGMTEEISIGLYDANSGKRLAITNTDYTVVNDAILLKTQ